jgi:hypothetical protein
MSQQAPPVLPPLVTCPSCGAQNYPSSQKCWVCLRSMADKPIVMATAVSPPDFLASHSLQIATSVMVPVLLGIALFAGAVVNETYAVIIAGLAMAMAVLTIVIGVRRGKVGNAILSLAVSVAAGFAACVLLIAAVIVFLFISCLSALR